MTGAGDLARGEGARLLPTGGVLGWGGGVPMFRLTGGGVRLMLGSRENLFGDGSRLDLDLCITGSELAGLLDLWERFPVEVADFSLLTSGFSMGGQGRGILDTQGVSGDGGAMTGERGGPAMMPAATCWMSLSHLSHRLRLTAGFSVSGVESGLPGGR